MNRLFALFLALFCIFFTGCQSKVPESTTTTLPPETTAPIVYPIPAQEEMPLTDADANWGLTLTATKVTRSNITLTIAQSGSDVDGELQTGAFFSLEAYDGSWIPATSLHPDEEIAWNAIAYLIPNDGELETVEDWSFLYGPLKSGWYRLGKEVTYFRSPDDSDTALFYVYFEVK